LKHKSITFDDATQKEETPQPQTKHYMPLSYTQTFGVSGLPIVQTPTLPVQPVN
jgi:hypothetical protein